MGEATYRATERSILYRSTRLGGKGKAAPIAAGGRSAPRGSALTRARALPLVGRERELGAGDALERSRAEREPQLVTLVGVPGIGKSRLVRARGTRGRARADDWRQGRCLPYGEGVSFWALGEIAKAQAGILETDAARPLLKLAEAVAASPTTTEAEWVIGHLRPLVGLGRPPAER